MIQSKQIQKPQLVLVVDDQEINRDVLGMILADSYTVIYAENGEEALEKMNEFHERISVVLLDLIMPVMDGFQVLETVRADEKLSQIPIIVLTAEKDAELKALKMGAADFITKPFDMHEVILARVGRIIELCEGRQLISAAEHDPITRLYNKNFFFEYANRIFTYRPELHMDAVAINIDQFHSVNALNGREYGDTILKILGEEIRSFLAETEGIASRFEADQFDIFCVGQDYQALVDRFQNRINAFARNNSIRLRMGLMPWHEGMDPLLQFDCARTACSMLRGNSVSNLFIYDDDLRTRELFNQRLLNDLRRAVDNRELKVYYQPKYRIQGDKPVLSSAEALIRWCHPELGMIPPGSFIPLFEGNGQISAVDRFVWSEAARQISEWQEKYGITIPVSVNVSRVDMFDATLKATLNGIVEKNDIKHRCLKLEVTESAYTENADQLIDVINELRELGFEIEMDDFGSGYSSLNMLSSMPIDVLKMDMKFIRNIEHSDKDFRLVELVLDIARYLDVPVVAEGVETEAQMRMLKDAGCDLIQGYYFSRPLPAEDFEKLIVREFNMKGSNES